MTCETCCYRDDLEVGEEHCELVDGQCPESVATQAYEAVTS